MFLMGCSVCARAHRREARLYPLWVDKKTGKPRFFMF